ncbi:MAG TPA: tetratricopeptide repeat protein, partial [Terriglobales bacterium]|nr:tetratricopeptide repeat protein [Terriglobales bacterium]
MAQINLRDYLKGLEELIDGGRAEEALAHCRHILNTFPKNMDTYRVMGKGFLELKQHSEANDIFQRVLSSAPDDFVSHIGMSIIREDEGKLDDSIWHMERAFEAQPSNRAVQDELRRLYGKREGYEPPKVRLTRGALARMYSHGDLYNQAVGELRSALSEDPKRPDLQVLLAEMYFRLNRQADAIDTCSKLIEKLPYCLIANRIMADILHSSHREVEAQPYLERIQELDPYAVQVGAIALPDEAIADTVMLEQMPEEAGADTPVVSAPKAWTATLQLPEGSNYQKEELPDWLSLDSLQDVPAENHETGIAQPVLEKLEELEPAPQVPDETAPDTEEPKTPTPFTSVSKSTALQADNIPDWLRELHPATGTLSMEDLDSTEQRPQAEKAEAQPAPPMETPAWLDELQQQTRLQETPKQETPAWLDELKQPAASEEKNATDEEDHGPPFVEPEAPQMPAAKEVQKPAM